MSFVISHPTGSPCARAVVRAISADGALDSFWTTLAVPPRLTERWLNGSRLGRQFGRRAFPEVPNGRLRHRAGREAVRIAARALRLSALTRHEAGWASVDSVYRDLDRRVATYLDGDSSHGVRAIYAYEDGALETFRAARRRGLRRIYDLPAIHWRTVRRLANEESQIEPEWACTLPGLKDSPEKLNMKDEEIFLADRIVVASSFTKRSLEEHFRDELAIRIVPYGAPPPRRFAPLERVPGTPLQVMFAGHLGQQKGIAYLARALARLDCNWRLTLAGSLPDFVPRELRALLEDERCTWLGHMPHATLLEEMDQAHVFVFPSLNEGFGLVLFEAMSAGLPVITTPNTAGPDIMTDGVEGYLVPIRDPEAIAARLQGLYEDEPLRQTMAAAALDRARAASWCRYEAMIRALVRETLS